MERPKFTKKVFLQRERDILDSHRMENDLPSEINDWLREQQRARTAEGLVGEEETGMERLEPEW